MACLSSFRSIKHPPFNIVLWDNGSMDGTCDAVREKFPEVLAYHNSTNLGAAAGRNAAVKLALEKATPSYLLFIDNDTKVTPTFLGALLAPFQSDKELGQTTPKIRLLGDEQRLDEAGGSRIDFWLGRVKVTGYREIDRGQYNRPVRCITGGCTLVRVDAFREVGGFDPIFDPYGYEDMDLSLRIRQAGYYALYIPDSLIFHQRSQTFEGGKYTEKYAAQKVRNWFVFMQRHASLLEKIGFVFVGGPYMLARAVLREGRRGNLQALRGLMRGVLDLIPWKGAS